MKVRTKKTTRMFVPLHQWHWTLWVGSIMVLVMMAGGVYAATTWYGPPSPTTDMSTLDSVLDLSDLVSKSKLIQQRLKGPLTVLNVDGANKYRYPVRLGFDDTGGGGSGNQYGAVGIGRDGLSDFTPVPAPVGIVGNFGIYGYATGGTTNYGMYTVSASGPALGAQVSNSWDYAAKLYGPLVITNPPSGNMTGSLTTSETMTVQSGYVSMAQIKLVAKNQTDGTFAMSGNVSTDAGANPGVGVYGASSISTAPGISIVANNQSLGAYGEAIGSSATTYGVYGVTAVGISVRNGVMGSVTGGASGSRGVYGEGSDFGIYGKADFVTTVGQSGAGIYACGITYAAQFVGDVLIKGSLSMSNVGVATDTNAGLAITPDAELTEEYLKLISASSSVPLNVLP